jgi:hypothetical protein
MRNLWTSAEDQVLLDNYRTLGPQRCLEMLPGRTLTKVYARAKGLALTSPMIFLDDNTIVQAIRELNADGYSDAEIKVELQSRHGILVDRHRIGILRRRSGIPDNRNSDRRRNRVANNTREQLASAGVESLAKLRLERWNQWKRDLGWPEHLTIRAVQALEMFWRHGPLTRIQLCELLGMDPKIRTNPKSNAKGGTVLAELASADLITTLRKVIPVKSDSECRHKVKYRNLYFLNPGVEPNGKTRKSTESREHRSTTPC